MTVTINGTTGIAGVDGSAATPAVQGVDTNTGVFYGTDIVAVSTGGTERMRVNASGNVGIGTTTPDSVLTINKNSAAPAAITVNPYLNIVGANSDSPKLNFDAYASNNNVTFRRANGTQASPSALSSGDQIGNLSVFGYGATGYTTTNRGFVAFFADEAWTDAAQGSRITFATTGVGTAAAATERMRIDSSGNVGIGTTAASSYGRLAVMTPTSNFGFFGIANSVASGGGVNIAQYYGTVKISYIDSTLENGTPGAETARLTFATSTAGTLTERMRIDSSGNVLIQETTSYARFTVTHAGATEFAITTNNTNTGGASQTSVGFRRNGAFVGTITTTASATAYNTSSDYRLKEDLQPMANVIDRVLALKPVNFAWKIDSSRVDGFLAHEAQDVVPECVTGTKDAMRDEEYEITAVIEATYDDEGNELTAVVPAVMGTRSVPDYQGIDQSKLVPLLTAAIQEQQAMITALTNRITALEATP